MRLERRSRTQMRPSVHRPSARITSCGQSLHDTGRPSQSKASASALLVASSAIGRPWCLARNSDFDAGFWYRADGHALRAVEVTFAFDALLGVDDVGVA